MFLENFFEKSARIYPENTAIEHDERKFSYKRVDEIANRLANYLREKEIGVEDKVVILLPRCAEVQISMLGILKSGAAFIPLDPEIPAERVNFIMEDAEAKLIITCDEILNRIGSELHDFNILNIDLNFEKLDSYSSIKPTEEGRRETDLCYIIYTSGTTGKPKGVLLEHRNVVTYLNAAKYIYPIDSEDRALQGFSVSFDASVEEIWVTFSAGATLVIGTFEIMRSGDQFASILNRLNITFLSCAPTLLSMVNDDIPSLKILIFGGEECGIKIANRWCKPNRTVYNTYGPTEGAVIATYSILEPCQSVTIGKALTGYDVRLVDENFEEITEPDKEGEIIIGGECVARGYLHRDDITAKKFIETDKFSGKNVRYYKTGDIAKYNATHDLVFIGRADAQVKVRGFRVELSEIEGLLVENESIQAAAVKLNEETKQLAAFVVLKAGKTVDRNNIAIILRKLLPYYMIPSTLDIIDELPLTTSQKIDRKRLPEPQTPLVFSGEKNIIPAVTIIEKEIVRVIGKNINRTDISMDDHFFNDLSGHSLLAAIVASELRKNKEFENLSVVDIYKFPILADLAHAVEQKQPREDSDSQIKREIYRPSKFKYFFSTICQGIILIPLIFLFGMEWLGPFFVYSYFYSIDGDFLYSTLVSLFSYFLILPTLTSIAIVGKWLILGKIKPGKYKIWGSYYLRFWTVEKIISICPTIYFAGTSIMNHYLRLMGAKVGKNSYINTSIFGAFDLLTIGDNVSISSDSSLRGVLIEDGYLKIGTITLSDNTFVGTRSCIGLNTKMEKNSSIDDLTLISDGMTIPANEHWGGTPPVKIRNNKEEKFRKLWSDKYTFFSLISVFLVPLVTMIAFFPGMILVAHINYMASIWEFAWVTFFIGISFVILLTGIITIFKWLLLGNLKEGKYPVNSMLYYKKWFFDQLMKLSLQVIGTLYTTLYLQKWFKLLGVKMGKRVEISTVRFISPDLLVAGNECFLADSVSVGASYVKNGYIEIAKTYIGNQTFVGNSAVLSPGTILGNNMLLGVLSKMKNEDLPGKDGTSWFGSPAVYLPQRDINHDFSSDRTYKPSRKLFFYRYTIEFFRVVLPSIFFIFFAGVITEMASYLQVTNNLWELFILFPFLYISAAILGILLVIVLKWIIIGKYRPRKKPLWSGFVWRSEMITGIYENFLVLFFLNILTGTPFIKYPLKWLGCKIGKRTCMYTTQITEFDLINIGDDCCINDSCTLQTHLFEDRVMKMSDVVIEDGCTVGEMSVVLYDSKMCKDSILDSLSVLMKNETLPAGATFIGAPSQRK